MVWSYARSPVLWAGSLSRILSLRAVGATVEAGSNRQVTWSLVRHPVVASRQGRLTKVSRDLRRPNRRMKLSAQAHPLFYDCLGRRSLCAPR
jgi:hypothetical protein